MKKFANFLINHRYATLAIMLVFAIVCGFLAMSVPINKDRTKYLKDESNLKQGLEIMEENFPEADEKSSIRVMFDDLNAQQIADVKARLKAIPNVNSVNYESDSDEYNKDNHTLFVVNSKFDYNSDEEAAIEEAIENGFPEYTMAYRNNDIQSTKVSFELLAGAMALVLVILLIMCASWLEPFLLLANIGIAIIINMGTNFFLPYIDEMTASVGPILQLALSMDYAIILINRYRQEKSKHENNFEAMKTALAASISAIASSSLTTVVGLLALVFLSFKLGPELGIVLAKGVFISMLCAFTILPVLILIFDKWLEKTRKKTPHVHMGLMAKISHKLRFIMPIIFIALFAGIYILQGSTAITFMEKSEDPLADVFPKDNTVVLVYNNKDENKIDNIISAVEKDEKVTDVIGFSNTIGKALDAKEMNDAIKEMDDKREIDEDIIRMLYFIAEDKELPTMTAAEFMNFITDSVLPNETLSKHLGDNIRDNVEYFEKFSDAEKLTSKMSAADMADFFGIDKKDVEELYLYYMIENGVANSGTMTLPAFVDFVLNTVAQDKTYGSMFDSATLASLKKLQTYTNSNTVQAKKTVPELAALLGIDENTVRTVFVLHNAEDVSGKTMTVSEFSSFLCDRLMKDPTFAGSFDETTKTRIQTLNSLIQLSISKQGLAPEQMAQILGMDAESVTGLYFMYFSATPAFQQEAAAMKMPLNNFLALLKANSSDEQLAQLAQTERLINLAASGQMLDKAAMANITGMTENEISAIYAMNAAEAMTLADFLSAAMQLAPGNRQLQQLNQIVQLAVSGTALNAPALASVFGIETAQVQQLFGLALASQKTLSVPEFTAFLANSVLANSAYAGSFSTEQAAQLQQMNQIVQLAVSNAPLDAATLAQVFGMDVNMINTVFRLYYAGDVGSKTMSLKEFVDFIISDPLMSKMMDKTSLEQLGSVQKIINTSVSGTSLSSSKLASLLGMKPAQTEQLYILNMYKKGAGNSWKVSPQEFVSFAVTDVLGNKDLEKYVDEQDAEDLKAGNTLIEAVVSGKSYTVSEMSKLLMSLTDDVSENEVEVMYLYYGGVSDKDMNTKMTISQLMTFIRDEMLDDERFASYFDEETRQEVLDSNADLNDAIDQMTGSTYSRVVITSNYKEESAETLDFISRLNDLRNSNLEESYLVGNSVMVSELDETFKDENFIISLITAVSIFIVVLIAFKNPTLPLILTLIVQCGVYITVTVIGAYSGSIYYLALLIVQSILMGATIDYGIVFCDFYMENRPHTDLLGALKAAYEGSIHTIMTSGSILVFVLAVLGIFTTSAMISEVSITLSIGALVAILLILFVLPGLVACFDKLAYRKKR